MSDNEEEGEQGYSVVFENEPEKKYPYLPHIDGKATATYANKDVFVGEYKDGKRNGKGTYTFASGAKYDGEYSNNKKHGQGTFLTPDGGKYVGGWANDKRGGFGTYTYPNGDRYEGDWRDGAKHGQGTFIYNGIHTSIRGTWSNGQLVDGQWKLHDGSSFSGSFLGNQPAGDGMFQFANGRSVAGRYVGGKFIKSNFVRPHPNDKPPPTTKADPLKKACRVVDKAVSKLDHHGSMHFLKTEVPGCANLRRVGKSPIYGCGQPSIDAFRKLNDQFTEAGFEKTISVCLRQDPVIYVNQLPYAPRDRKNLDAPLVLSAELTTGNIKELEDRMADNTRFAIKRKGNLHDYFEEMYRSPEMPEQHDNEAKTVTVKEAGGVRSISAVYEFLGEEDVALTYERVPIPEERPPSAAAFDAICTIVRGLEGAAVLFNDQMGFGRVTTAQAIAALLIKEAPAEEAEEEAGEEEEGGEPKPAKGPKVPPTYDEMAPDYSLGQYDVIQKLVRKINGPTAEELEAMRVAEKEQRKAEKEAKAAAEARAKAEAEAEALAAAEAEGAEGAAEGEAAAEDEAPAEEAPAEGEAPAEEAPAEGAPADAEAADDFVSSIPAEPSNLGDMLKMEVDAAIDRASALLNLRTAIMDVKKQHDSVDENERVVYKARAMNYVERYAHLIIFAMYVKEQQAAGEEGFATPFAKWVEGKTELFDVLGNRVEGPLSKFDFA